jgi:antitoxin PrlF
MPTATLTSKGQLTVPKSIRDRLLLRQGDAVEFVVNADGTVQVRAGRVDVAELRGILRKAGRRPVSLEAMDAAIRRAHGDTE